MSETKSELLHAAKSSGETFLKLCQILHAQGVNLSQQSPSIVQVSQEIQKLLQTYAKGFSPEETKQRLSTGHVTGGKTTHIRQLRTALYDGTYLEKFPIGTIIPDAWTDGNTGIICPMSRIIVDYRIVELANHEQQLGAILLSQTAVPREIAFDEEGCNVFAKSDLERWLNGNNPDNYLAGCSPELLEVVAEVIVDSVPVKFFPPSLEELHFDPYKNPELKDLVWEYFRDTPTDWRTPCSKRVFQNPISDEPKSCWLRSAGRGDSYGVWRALTDGSAYFGNANYTRACAPACVIIGKSPKSEADDTPETSA